MSKSKKVVPPPWSSSTSPAWWRGRPRARAWATASSAGIREVDAIVLVLRAFEDDNVVGGTDPLDDLHTLELELVLADVDSVETQLAQAPEDGQARHVAARARSTALEAALESLQAGTPIYRSALTAEQRAACAPSFLLTNKPVLAVVNLGEDQVADADAV